MYSAFLTRLRSFGYDRFFINADVHRTPFMSQAEFDGAVKRAEEFIRASTLQGTVSVFPDGNITDEFERRQAAEWVKTFGLDDETIVLFLDHRSLFIEEEELKRLVSAVPPGQTTLYTCGGVLSWETACAYRFRYEREIRSLGKPVQSSTSGATSGQTAPVPLSIQFEPTAAFDDVLAELLAAPEGRWTRADLGNLWKSRPALFRRHISHVGIELTNDDNLPSRIRSPRLIAPQRPIGRMTDAIWKRLLADLPRGPLPLSIDFWDFGEPLLHPSAVDWIREAASAGYRVDLRTNALAIDDAAAEKLVASGVDAVFVRLDAASPEGYGRATGEPARFAEASAGLERLMAAKKTRPIAGDGCKRPILAVEITEMNETHDDVDRFFAKYDYRTAVAGELKSRLAREPSDSEILAELYKTHDPLEHAIYRHDNLYRGRIPRAAESVWTPLYRFPCRQLHEGPYILWDGAIVPCREDVEEEKVVGHVEDGLMNVWRGDALGNVFRFHDTGCSAADHFCSGCGEWYYPFA